MSSDSSKVTGESTVISTDSSVQQEHSAVKPLLPLKRREAETTKQTFLKPDVYSFKKNEGKKFYANVKGCKYSKRFSGRKIYRSN